MNSLIDVESRLNLRRTEDDRFFTEWQTELLDLSPSEAAAIEIARRRLRSEMMTGVSVSLATPMLIGFRKSRLVNLLTAQV